MVLLISLIVAAENAWPHNSSVIAFTFRVETPWTYIWASAETRPFPISGISQRAGWKNVLADPWGMRNFIFPTLVTRERL
jgi:hypothetical protein